MCCLIQPQPHTQEAGRDVLQGKGISHSFHFRQPTVRYGMKALLLHQYNAIMGFREIAHAMKQSIFLSLATSCNPSGALSQNRCHTSKTSPWRTRCLSGTSQRLWLPWLTAFILRKPFNWLFLFFIFCFFFLKNCEGKIKSQPRCSVGRFAFTLPQKSFTQV